MNDVPELLNKIFDGSIRGLRTASTFEKNQAGTWGYQAGVSGTVNVAAGRKVIGISAHATTAGSIAINGGDSIPLPAGMSISLSPLGNLIAPSIVFTGTDTYIVESLG